MAKKSTKILHHINNSTLLGRRYDSSRFITELGKILTRATSLQSLVEKTARHIEATIEVSGSAFVVHQKDAADLIISSQKKLLVNKATIEQISLHLANEPEALRVEALRAKRPPTSKFAKALDDLEAHNVAVILPFSSQVGFALLGEKRTDYTARDMRILSAVSDELLIAIENMRSIQQMRELNKDLQKRIDAATEELRASNEEFRKLDETKDEFISMASHQLRTPLTSVKGYISMVLEGDVGEISDEQRHYLGQAFTSSERMVRLIGDFLNVSRLQTGKFIIDAHATDLVSMIEQEVEVMRIMAEGHHITFSFRPPRHIPKLMIDEDKIHQVVMNFIDNAIFYSPRDSTVAVKLYVEGGDVVFEVHDQGIGVPREAQKRLFTKFFRAENARKQRPDGTGVGLFLAKKVITETGGEIVFHSNPGKSSVFGFRLPIAKLRVDTRK